MRSHRPSLSLSARALVLFAFTGCFQEVSRTPLGDAAASDAGDVHPDAAPGDAGADVTRWVANGPEGEIIEGSVHFALTCVGPTGRPGDCYFGCAYDRGDEEPCAGAYDVAWAEASPFGFTTQPHQFCVQARPKDGSDPGSRLCRHFAALAHPHAFGLVPSPISPASTNVRMPLVCGRTIAGRAERSAECSFECSLDGRPYARCHDAAAYDGVGPGEHMLRVAVTKRVDELEHEFTRVTAMPFTIDAGAEPRVTPPTPPVFPPFLGRDELTTKGVAMLLDPYGDFALACAAPGSAASRAEHVKSLQAWLSAAVQSPQVSFVNAPQRDACIAALNERPAPCRSLPGVNERDTEDGLLTVRLPAACRGLFAGTREPGEPCLTHAECGEGSCEWPWNVRESTGYCAALPDPETREGIMCNARGCGPGLYCNRSACTVRLDVGAACEAPFGDVVCREGARCVEGLCVEAP